MHWMPLAAGALGRRIEVTQVMNYVGNVMRKRYCREEERLAALERWRGWVGMMEGRAGGVAGEIGGGGEVGGGVGGGLGSEVGLGTEVAR